MFEIVVVESSWDGGDRLPDDDFDGAWGRLLADAEVVPDYPPGEVATGRARPAFRQL